MNYQLSCHSYSITKVIPFDTQMAVFVMLCRFLYNMTSGPNGAFTASMAEIIRHKNLFNKRLIQQWHEYGIQHLFRRRTLKAISKPLVVDKVKD